MKWIKINESDSNKTFAYHATNVPPEVLKREGFKPGKGGGFTQENLLEEVYSTYLPSNPVFVSMKPYSANDTKMKYLYRIDITGLEKYPDFGNLFEMGEVYFEDEGFWFSDGTIQDKEFEQYINENFEDGFVYYDQFGGDESWDWNMTCAIDGDELDMSRVQLVNS